MRMIKDTTRIYYTITLHELIKDTVEAPLSSPAHLIFFSDHLQLPSAEMT